MELSEEQVEAVHRDEPVTIQAPEPGEVVVISTTLYDRVRELLETEEDRKLQAAWLKLTQQGRAAAVDRP